MASTLAAAMLAASPGLAFSICVEGTYPPFSEIAPDGILGVRRTLNARFYLAMKES